MKIFKNKKKYTLLIFKKIPTIQSSFTKYSKYFDKKQKRKKNNYESLEREKKKVYNQKWRKLNFRKRKIQKKK